MSLEIANLPKSRGVLLLKVDGSVVWENTYSNVYKSASAVANELRSGIFRDERIQGLFNQDPTLFEFDHQDATASDVAEAEEVNAIAENDALVEELTKSEQVMDQLEAQAKKVGMTRAERVAATHEEARRLGFWDGQGKWEDAYTAMQKWKKENGFLGKPFGTAKR